MKIVVASKNPVKVNAAREGFQRMFEGASIDVSGVAVASGVSDQPIGDAETLLGATQRARAARRHGPDADFTVGIEGGCGWLDDDLTVFAWVVVMDATEKTGRSKTGMFFLPDEVARLVAGGLELGDADDRVFGGQNTKQKNGSIGLLTGDVLDRQAYYVQAVIMALIPFKNTTLTFR